MKLNQLINQYITYRKSLGEKFKTNESYLKSFCKKIGPSTNIKSIDKGIINNFLYGDVNSITSGWFIKHTAILGFYRYALTRNYVTAIPLPSILPKRPQPFVPYIYSQEELKALFNTALNYQKNKSHIPPRMVQTVLVLTYALGLRLHETLSIKLGDIDMNNAVITIQQSKFYKSRLVPFNQETKEVINKYLQWRKKQNQLQSAEIYLFLGKNNQPFNIGTMRGIFERIRQKAEIARDDHATYQPRIHDLRHTFAVNRLTSWYQENKNVQQLLPILSVYLGHKHLAHTTVYLTMTDDLLQEAKTRFEQFAVGEQQ
ncbi:MAG TPA: tyrosine-type recombinase/integrase [Gammaproteobacteria bacterium]|nr:tyrosine-type recombinase/integrase [Gammaproteobacteria bacterium]